MARLIRRTVWRVVSRRRLSHGNRETWRRTLSRDPQVSILVWTWTQHAGKRAAWAAAAASSPQRWVRLRSPREAENWLAGLP